MYVENLARRDRGVTFASACLNEGSFQRRGLLWHRLASLPLTSSLQRRGFAYVGDPTLVAVIIFVATHNPPSRNAFETPPRDHNASIGSR
jgi:hypothetical protein